MLWILIEAQIADENIGGCAMVIPVLISAYSNIYLPYSVSGPWTGWTLPRCVDSAHLGNMFVVHIQSPLTGMAT
jgi:hypothetical protein